jgi:hypothetical protein
LVTVGSIVRVAAYDAANGAEVDVRVERVFDLPKTAGDAIVAGDVVKASAAGVVECRRRRHHRLCDRGCRRREDRRAREARARDARDTVVMPKSVSVLATPSHEVTAWQAESAT